MKVARSTRQRVAEIKVEATEAIRKLELIHARLDEQTGMKMSSRKLAYEISRLYDWLKCA